MSELPEGWIEAPFMDVFDIQGGTQPPKSVFKYDPHDGYVRLLQIRDFGQKPLPTYIPIKSTLKRCAKDDVLIGRYGASVGRICSGMEGAYNVALAKVVIPCGVDKKFVNYLLKSELFQRPILDIERSAQDGFNKEDLTKISLPIPPTNEQRRIVAKLEKVLSRVGPAQLRIATIPRILKRFRQSVLAAAFERQSEQDLKRLDEIFSVQTGGTPYRKNPEFYRGGTIPWIKTGEVRNRDIHQSEEFITEEGLNSSNAKIFPSGTLLIAMYGEGKTRGQVARLRVEAATNQACAALVNPQLSDISNQYVFLFLLSQYHKMRAEAVGGNQPNLNLSIIKSWEVPFPSEAEQLEIVRRVEALFKTADALEARYRKAKEHVDKLTQSILVKAFRGELVPQDPNDEPASILLERIQGGKEDPLGAKSRAKS